MSLIPVPLLINDPLAYPILPAPYHTYSPPVLVEEFPIVPPALVPSPMPLLPMFPPLGFAPPVIDIVDPYAVPSMLWRGF